MKKRISVVLSLLLLLASISALAENVITFDPAVAEQMGLQGEFVAMEDFGLQFYLPGPLSAFEVTQEQADQGTYALFSTADGTSSMSIGYAAATDAQGSEVTDLEALAALYSQAGAANVETGEINGLPCISYTFSEAGVMGVAFLTEKGHQLTFNFAPFSDESYKAAAMLVVSSIMPLE